LKITVDRVVRQIIVFDSLIRVASTADDATKFPSSFITKAKANRSFSMDLIALLLIMRVRPFDMFSPFSILLVVVPTRGNIKSTSSLFRVRLLCLTILPPPLFSKDRILTILMCFRKDSIQSFQFPSVGLGEEEVHQGDECYVETEEDEVAASCASVNIVHGTDWLRGWLTFSMQS